MGKKIFEKNIIRKIFLINELRKEEKMNQYKFSGAFVEEITKKFDDSKEEDKTEKLQEENEEIKLTDYNVIFNDK